MVKNSTVDNLKYVSYFSHKISCGISCKLSSCETICMKYQILLSGKNEKNIINLSYAEFFHRKLRVIYVLLFQLCRSNQLLLQTTYMWLLIRRLKKEIFRYDIQLLLSRKHAYIILTPFKPHSILFFFLEAVLTSTNNLCFEQKYEKY